MCPDYAWGLTTVKLALAQLVQCFDWELIPYGTQPKDIDMTEVFGLSVPRANHLLAKPIYVLLGLKYISKGFNFICCAWFEWSKGKKASTKIFDCMHGRCNLDLGEV